MFDRYDTDEKPGDYEPHCKRCGATDVRWRRQTDKWVLFSLKPGVEHVCELDTDAFDYIEEEPRT
jgi:hypothetical protein